MEGFFSELWEVFDLTEVLALPGLAFDREADWAFRRDDGPGSNTNVVDAALEDLDSDDGSVSVVRGVMRAWSARSVWEGIFGDDC